MAKADNLVLADCCQADCCSAERMKNEKNSGKQAGAELCQAQEKPRLAKLALPVVIFHLL